MDRTASEHTGSDRQAVFSYAAQRYGTQPEYLWTSFPGYAVLRHRDNGKWYGLIMDVPRSKLGLPGPGRVDVLEVKVDPAFGGGVSGQPGILPAYHMQRDSWCTVLLDGTVPPPLLFTLLDSSYAATAPARKRPGPREPQVWIVPANPHYYDVQAAFACQPVVRWKQSSAVAVEDRVYLYVTAPVCAVLYRCRAIRVDIPWHYDDGHVRTERAMDLEKLGEYAPDFLTRDKLKAYGVRAVRGPRRLPHRLACLLEQGCTSL